MDTEGKPQLQDSLVQLSFRTQPIFPNQWHSLDEASSTIKPTFRRRNWAPREEERLLSEKDMNTKCTIHMCNLEKE